MSYYFTTIFDPTKRWDYNPSDDSDRARASEEKSVFEREYQQWAEAKAGRSLTLTELRFGIPPGKPAENIERIKVENYRPKMKVGPPSAIDARVAELQAEVDRQNAMKGSSAERRIAILEKHARESDAKRDAEHKREQWLKQPERAAMLEAVAELENRRKFDPDREESLDLKIATFRKQVSEVGSDDATSRRLFSAIMDSEQERKDNRRAEFEQRQTELDAARMGLENEFNESESNDAT